MLLPVCIKRESKLCVMPVGFCPLISCCIPKTFLCFSIENTVFHYIYIFVR